MEHSPGEPGHIDTDERLAQVPADNDYWHRYINEHVASEFVGFTVAFLQNLRSRGGGPPYSKIGRQVRYRRRDIAAWADEKVRVSTSDPGQAAA